MTNKIKENLKTVFYYIAVYVIAVIWIIALMILTVRYSKSTIRKEIQNIEVEMQYLKDRIEYLENTAYLNDSYAFNHSWFLKTVALAIVESNLDSRAINGSSYASGILQIMPIYVREANRLQDTVVFTRDDVFCIEKSVQMFSIINNVRNPNNCIRQCFPCKYSYKFFNCRDRDSTNTCLVKILLSSQFVYLWKIFLFLLFTHFLYCTHHKHLF